MSLDESGPVEGLLRNSKSKIHTVPLALLLNATSVRETPKYGVQENAYRSIESGNKYLLVAGKTNLRSQTVRCDKYLPIFKFRALTK